MRKLTIAAIGLAALAFLAEGALAETILLKGKYTAQQIKTACDNAGGAYNTGQPYRPGHSGYQCSTNKGNVTCDADGVCTGTCNKCGARLTPGIGIRSVLGGGTAGVKQTTGGQAGPNTTLQPARPGALAPRIAPPGSTFQPLPQSGPVLKGGGRQQ
jgi:hypothetical protein